MFYEVYFAVPFDILFNDAFEKLIKFLGISIDMNWLDMQFDKSERGKGDMHVFYSSSKEDFIFLDLYFGLTDQHGMVCIGVHINSQKEHKIKEIMMEIYNDEDAVPKSDFNEYRDNRLINEIDSRLFLKRTESYNQNIFYNY